MLELTLNHDRSEPYDKGYAHVAFIEDPDGHKAELVQRGTMKVGDITQ